MVAGEAVAIVLSRSGPVQVRALQNEPALATLPTLMTVPTSPLSKRTPVSGLSNLFSSSAERTPRLYRSSSSRSTFARSHVGASQPRQPNGSRDLDLQHDRHPARVDDAPRLVRVGDDLEEPPARPAGLRVDVALQFADVVEPAPHRRHLVAVGPAVGLQRAQHAVLVDAHDHQPQPGHPRALHPAPVGALVGQVRRLPLRQRRIAARVVRIHRRPVVEEVLERRRRPGRPLDRRAVRQRRGDPVRMPRRARSGTARRSTRMSSSACGRRPARRRGRTASRRATACRSRSSPPRGTRRNPTHSRTAPARLRAGCDVIVPSSSTRQSAAALGAATAP